jgi:hypothetical protein
MLENLGIFMAEKIMDLYIFYNTIFENLQSVVFLKHNNKVDTVKKK